MSQHPAGIFPPGAQFRQGPPPPVYYSALASPKREVVFLTELDVDAVSSADQFIRPFVAGVFSPVGRIHRTVTTTSRSKRRWATRPFITSATETPAREPVEARISPIVLERRIESEGGVFAAIASSSVGNITVRNDDGALDDLDTAAVVIGREIAISVAAMVDGQPTGGSAGLLSAFGLVHRGVVESVGWRARSAEIIIRDYRLKLQRPLSRTFYSGRGGIDGGEELRGVSRPLAFGNCRNVKPTLIDAANLIYQVHDGAVRGIDVVRDSGLPLQRHSSVRNYDTLLALVQPDSDDQGDFPLGSYVVCPNIGCFRLAGQPVGAITADIRGDGAADADTGGGIDKETWADGTLFSDGTGFSVNALRFYARTAADVMSRIFTEFADFGETDVNTVHMAQMAAERPYEVGLYVEAGSQLTVQDAVTILARSIGCVLLRGSDGTYQLRAFVPPRASPVLTITPDMLTERELERLEVPYKQPWATIEVGYGRNWTPMGEADLVGAVTGVERANLVQPSLVARATSDELTVLYPDRAPLSVDTLLVNGGDADALGAQLQAFYPRGRCLYRAAVKGIAFRLELMDTVRLVSPRFGLQTGKNLLIVGMVEDGASRNVVLELFGGEAGDFVPVAVEPVSVGDIRPLVGAAVGFHPLVVFGSAAAIRNPITGAAVANHLTTVTGTADAIRNPITGAALGVRGVVSTSAAAIRSPLTGVGFGTHGSAPAASDNLLLTEAGDNVLLTEGGDPILLTEAAAGGGPVDISYAPLALIQPKTVLGRAVWGTDVANTDIGGASSTMCAYIGVAPISGSFNHLTVWFITHATEFAYSAGDGGTIRCSIQTVDGSNNPTGTLIGGSVDYSPGLVAGHWVGSGKTQIQAQFPDLTLSSPAGLAEGQKFAMVFQNVHASPTLNYVGLDHLLQYAGPGDTGMGFNSPDLDPVWDHKRKIGAGAWQSRRGTVAPDAHYTVPIFILRDSSSGNYFAQTFQANLDGKILGGTTVARQLFTPPTTVTVDRAYIMIGRQIVGCTSFRLGITLGSATTETYLNSNTAFADTDISALSVQPMIASPINQTERNTQFTGRSVLVTFPAPVTLTSGTQYALLVSTPTSGGIHVHGCGIGSSWWAGRHTDPFGGLAQSGTVSSFSTWVNTDARLPIYLLQADAPSGAWSDGTLWSDGTGWS